MSRRLWLAAVVVLAVACSGNGGSDPQPANTAQRLLEDRKKGEERLKSPVFQDMSDLIASGEGVPPVPQSLPPLPERSWQAPPPSWWGETLDVTSFETLQASLDATLAQMPVEVAQIYDDAVKYLLIQVSVDPVISGTASAGGTPSEEQIMAAVRRILHRKTPPQIIQEAEQLSEGIAQGGGPG